MYYNLYEKETEFEKLRGKTLTGIKGLEVGSSEVTFICADGSEFFMYHQQDCCEGVSVEDVCGDVTDLLNSKILIAEVRASGENPPDIKKEDYGWQESFTWTFYELATNKGSVTIRWYGESNGYYSESVDFAKTK